MEAANTNLTFFGLIRLQIGSENPIIEENSLLRYPWGGYERRLLDYNNFYFDWGKCFVFGDQYRNGFHLFNIRLPLTNVVKNLNYFCVSIQNPFIFVSYIFLQPQLCRKNVDYYHWKSQKRSVWCSPGVQSSCQRKRRN